MTTKTIEKHQRTFLPAAGRDWLLPLYDPFVKLLGGDSARRALLDQAKIQPGHHILDIGCGTGSLVILIKQLYPDAITVGLDPDPKALARAKRKAERAAVSIQFDEGFSDELPYGDASFDRVFSSFMFHHLEENEKEKTLSEVRRVLKPGGSLHLLDFGGPKHGGSGILARLFHASHRLKDNSEDRILGLMSQAGLAQPKKVSDGRLLFGLLRTAYYQASAPA
ncbi:MAG TPA: class I SAM-dependent methyltransferase [Blastocatellia bacterium]|nr:class I SAM-dependent methyltransferase [Blastocatellia bacterium]